MSIFRCTRTALVFGTFLVLGSAAANAESPTAPALDPAVDAALADALVAPPPPDGAAAGDDAFAAGGGDTDANGEPAAELEGALDDPLQSSFSRFCDSWMEKLAQRERRNQGLIEWQSGTNWVQGSYVGYTKEHKCSIEGATSPSPVGRLSYLEVKYERRGASVPDAMASVPTPVETTEVTEFFRYDGDGKWVY